MAVTTPLFTQHSRSWRDHRYVYPVISRRSRGLSIGVNLNPDKACNFDCVYCSVDRSVPATVTEVDLDVLRSELDHLIGLAADGSLFIREPFDRTPESLRRINDVAFSGDGEPTAYARFADACRLAVELLDWHGLLAVKVVVITNATLLDRPGVQAAIVDLGQRGEVWAKLDAGTEEHYRAVERSKVPLARVLANLLSVGRARPIVIQSLFMRLRGQGPPPSEIDAWIGRLRDLRAAGCRIDRVQVYTTARATAEAFVQPLPHDEVEAIAQRARGLGLVVEAFHGPS